MSQHAPTISESDIDRFWGNVEKKGPTPDQMPGIGPCWVWLAGCTSGYGYFYLRNPYRQIGAHRLSWQLAMGPIPDELWVLHHCDNRKCVNPGHLFLGTNLDNIADRTRKGRGYMRPGAAHPRAKLAEQDVISIRQQYALGSTSYRKLAAIFNVSERTVRGIVRREYWASLTESKVA